VESLATTQIVPIELVIIITEINLVKDKAKAKATNNLLLSNSMGSLLRKVLSMRPTVIISLFTNKFLLMASISNRRVVIISRTEAALKVNSNRAISPRVIKIILKKLLSLSNHLAGTMATELINLLEEDLTSLWVDCDTHFL